MQELKKRLEDEIAALENELRIELPREILRAREYGDLSENAEYHAAKERQAWVNAKLGQLNGRLREISMIDMSRIPHDRVGLGSKVIVMDTTKDERITYRLVTSEDVDVAKGLISTSSPYRARFIGQASGRYSEDSDPGRVARDGNRRIAHDSPDRRLTRGDDNSCYR